MLQFDAVQKFYSDRQVLGIPSLQLGQGVYWLRGENGSGKTTLLRMIAGLLPFRGDILCRGISISRQPVPYRMQVGWAEAEPLYPPFVTGQELIAFYRKIRRASAEQIETLLSLFGMHQWISDPVRTYSSGMMKKLSLVLAFLGSPSLILLDEPLTTLDADAVPALLQLIRHQSCNAGTGFLLSSHHDLPAEAIPGLSKLSVAAQKLSFSA